ncbi:acyltransferase family protein [Mucilaginibacter sp.]|uniref:acyltransferase n=1 Tax=Mucilaginibacter sp. TaxID=1882438 RepID=UPI0026021635|nr:acyltransferase family protein [Mucilaginibacter sp.]MDB5030461.1 yiaH 1 [Mucilaginibacter sp.]
MTTAKSQNFEWINSLRLIALLAVIVLHAAAIPLGQYGHIPINIWLTADFYNSLVRFAVPVFVMITGALLLHRDYELGNFLKKRLSRVVAPFLFWSLVYIGYSWYNEELAFEGGTLANVKQVLHQLKYGSSYHLWYVYMLIGLYFFVPIISKFVRNATKREIEYFLIMWLIIMIISQPYIVRFNPQIDLHYFAGYAGYLVLGHYLTFNFDRRQNIVLVMFILFVSVVCVIFWGTYLIYKYNGFITLLYEPLGPAIVLLASAVFLMARFTKIKLPAFVKQAQNFACKFNFGIYLSHALVLYFLDDLFGISYKLCARLISIPVTAIICFLLSLLLVWLLSKLPYIGKWVAGI